MCGHGRWPLYIAGDVLLKKLPAQVGHKVIDSDIYGYCIVKVAYLFIVTAQNIGHFGDLLIHRRQ